MVIDKEGSKRLRISDFGIKKTNLKMVKDTGLDECGFQIADCGIKKSNVKICF